MWDLGNQQLTSRLILGTAQYPSLQILTDAIQASATQMITVSLRRQHGDIKNDFWAHIQQLNCKILPNTAGCRNAKEAVMTAEMAREIFQTHWIKLEVIGDDYNLQPDPFELVAAAQILIKKGFEVLPYCTDDFIVCQRLLDVGCKILMPWAAPIGSAKGIINPYALTMLRERLANVTLIIDAGLGRPSHAALAMELGFDGVLLNSAVALAEDPVLMAAAFRDAVIAGRKGYCAGLLPERNLAQQSTPLIDTPFWHQE